MKEIKIKLTDRIFFLDDDIQRIWAFKKLLSNVGFNMFDQLVIAESVGSAEFMLEEEPPCDIYFLDHDLTSDHYDDLEKSAESGKGTGQEVIPLIQNVQDARFVVHTMNPFGADKMGKILTGLRCKGLTKCMFGHFVLVIDKEEADLNRDTNCRGVF